MKLFNRTVFEGHEKEWFRSFFGPYARAASLIKAPLHGLSFISGFVVSLSIMLGFVHDYNLEKATFVGVHLGGFFETMPWFLAAAFGLVLEYAHHEAPNGLGKMLFNPKLIVRSLSSFAMFICFVVAAYYVTVASSYLSSKGGQTVAKNLAYTPPETDITDKIVKFQADSARIEQVGNTQLAAIDAQYKAEVNRIDAAYKAEQSEQYAIINKYKAIRAKGEKYKWAQGYVNKATAAIRAAKNGRDVQLAEAEAAKEESRSEILTMQGTRLDDLGTSFRQYRIDVESSDQDAKDEATANNKALQGFVGGFGSYLPWVIMLLSLFIAFYDANSGHEPLHKPFTRSGRMARAWSTLTGIFTDKYDHQVTRLEVTRDHLRQRNEARPYALPKGKYILIGVLVAALAFFVSATIPFGDTTTAEMTFVPFPWNWTGLILCILSLVLTGWRPQWSARGSAPEAVEQSTSVTDADIREQVELLTMSLSYCDAGERPGIGEQIELLELSLMI